MNDRINAKSDLLKIFRVLNTYSTYAILLANRKMVTLPKIAVRDLVSDTWEHDIYKHILYLFEFRFKQNIAEDIFCRD